MEVIILCGGTGTRLMPLTKNKHKALVEVDGKPIIEWQLRWLQKYDIEKKNVILACGHMLESLKNYLGNSVKYSIEKEPLGTGGALKQAMRLIKDDEFLVFNVDDLNNIDLGELKRIGSNSICVANPRSPFGVVELQGNKVTGFIEKPLLEVWVSMGIYLLNKDIIKMLPDKGSLEKEVFPKIDLKAYKHEGYWHTINNIKQAQAFDAEAFKKALDF